MGATHKFSLALLKDDAANPNTWHAEIYSVPDGDVSGSGRPGQLAQGLLKFNQDGSIDQATSTLFGAAGAPTSLTLGASTASSGVKWSTAQGIAGQTVDLDLSNLTQYAQASTVNSVNSDGAGVGNVVGVSVDKDGVVSAIFDNSQIRKIAKVALATFPSPDGLKAVSGNAYQAASSSGQFTLKEPGLGAGDIASSSLEASTVDLSAEFTGLITTQKAYSASSKIITTADQMLEELINIIR
jgi:flagellar hook protein FlgE